MFAAYTGTTDPFVHTYSIVARDPHSSQMGVAVQSHYFAVGSAVPWVEAGKAMELGPDITELKFRGSEILFRAGQVQEALALLREVFAREPIWAELIPRMAAVGLLPNDPALLKCILDQRS
jgi:Family of unknown function (DUF1028)